MKKKNIIILIIVFAVITPFAISVKKFIDKFEEMSKVEMPKTPYKINKEFLYGLNIRNNKVDTILLKGVSVINFWASWCKPCIEEIPSLEALKTRNPSINIYLFSFDSIQAQKKISKKNNWFLPAYYISDTVVFNIPQLLPKTYIIRNDTVYKEIYGARNWEDSLVFKSIGN